MTAAALALTVESPAGRADLLIDGSKPLRQLLPALAAATGMTPPTTAASGSFEAWEGLRRLDTVQTPIEAGVVAGSVLRLTPATPDARDA